MALDYTDGKMRDIEALLEPLTDFIRYMPAVAFIPLVMLWVGIGEGSKIAIIFIGTFFDSRIISSAIFQKSKASWKLIPNNFSPRKSFIISI